MLLTKKEKEKEKRERTDKKATGIIGLERTERKGGGNHSLLVVQRARETGRRLALSARVP